MTRLRQEKSERRETKKIRHGTFTFDCVDCIIDQSNDRHYGGLLREKRRYVLKYSHPKWKMPFLVLAPSLLWYAHVAVLSAECIPSLPLAKSRLLADFCCLLWCLGAICIQHCWFIWRYFRFKLNEQIKLPTKRSYHHKCKETTWEENNKVAGHDTSQTLTSIGKKMSTVSICLRNSYMPQLYWYFCEFLHCLLNAKQMTFLK